MIGVRRTKPMPSLSEAQRFAGLSATAGTPRGRMPAISIAAMAISASVAISVPSSPKAANSRPPATGPRIAPPCQHAEDQVVALAKSAGGTRKDLSEDAAGA